MKQSVLAIVGISGVGKSTLLRSAAEHLKFQHLQASALIKQAKEPQNSGIVLTDDLRRGDITHNQALLVQGFQNAVDPTTKLVVLDGHTIIDTPNGLISIEPSVFQTLGVAEFVFIADDPKAIEARRTSDQLRNRPSRSASELAHHQEQALLAAFKAALSIGAPLHTFTPAQSWRVRESLMRAANYDAPIL